MTEGLDAEIEETESVTEQRDEVVAQVQDHAGQIARELALLDGGDYGQQNFDTDGGEWTLKYEAGAIQYLRFDPKSGSETYVVSGKSQPDPDELAEAMDDYAAFVESYNRHVRSLDGVLDDVRTEFPAVESADSIVEDRNRIVARIREVADTMARELQRFDGTEYGTFAKRAAGKRWELKWDQDGVSYLRVGGEGGTYLVSQYEPPSAPEVRRLAEKFGDFVETFNEHVEELDADLSQVSLDD
ncbi:hypothetical protein [Halorussus halophilus]|uniref:hypothetical protein n=1 Tax=Halorussus halophilus TaxID=2650975 RepID=UPI00130103EE|nr:hypothetical protein [Halorussus halophilus]